MIQQTTHNMNTKPKATLNRVKYDVNVQKTPIVRAYTELEQTIDNETSRIYINDNEVGDLIEVLQNYKEQLQNQNEV